MDEDNICVNISPLCSFVDTVQVKRCSAQIKMIDYNFAASTIWVC
jgi:hypothetical protein